jgi:hypothetical protein
MYKFTCELCKKEFEYPFEKQTCVRHLCYRCGEACANEGKVINLGDTGCEDCPFEVCEEVSDGEEGIELDDDPYFGSDTQEDYP